MRVGFFRRIYKICWKSEELSGKKPGKNDRIVTEGKVHFPAVKTVEAEVVRDPRALVRRPRSEIGKKSPPADAGGLLGFSCRRGRGR